MGGGGLEIPWPLLKEIQRRYSTDTERNQACADYYVNHHPEAKWKDLTTGHTVCCEGIHLIKGNQVIYINW